MNLTPEGIELSVEVALLVGAENGECFSNALYGLHALDYKQGIVYVEGVTSNDVLLCHHGWLELPNGMIIDPTPCYHKRNKLLGPADYFPAERWSVGAIGILFEDEDLQLPLIGWEGREFENAGYRTAYRRAARATFTDQVADMYLSQLNKRYPE